MFERFTDTARKVMANANAEARRRNHEFIGSEHVLLAIVLEGQNPAAQALREFNITAATTRKAFEAIAPSGPDMVLGDMEKLPKTPDTKQLIEFSIQEARDLHSKEIDVGHILLAILRQEGTFAKKIFGKLEITDFDTLRKRVIELMGGPKVDPKSIVIPPEIKAMQDRLKAMTPEELGPGATGAVVRLLEHPDKLTAQDIELISKAYPPPPPPEHN